MSVFIRFENPRCPLTDEQLPGPPEDVRCPRCGHGVAKVVVQGRGTISSDGLEVDHDHGFEADPCWNPVCAKCGHNGDWSEFYGSDG